MRYSVEGLCADVMARLGEIARPQGQASASSVPWPEDIICLKVRSSLAEVGGRLIREAPAEPLSCGVEGLSDVVSLRLMPCGLYAAEVRLPDDFLRLVSVKMSGWRSRVFSLVPAGTPEWQRQWSEHPGIAGCAESPRAYLDSDADGLLLRLVGSMEEDTLEWLGAWCVPSPSEDGEFDFPELLYPHLVGAMASSMEY